LAVLAAIYLLLQRVGRLPPHKRRGEYLKLIAGIAVVAVVLLTLTGKMHWVGAALTGLLVVLRQSLPLLIRLFPLLGQLGHRAQAGTPRQSTVTTATLRMHLDLESGAMSGDVLAGPFRDWRLDEMNREQLRSLLDYCREQDPESAPLLEGYLEQRFGAGDSGDAQGEAHGDQRADGAMSRREALEILGLGDDADRQAITDAHRKLMQKLHPDRGGSDWLAAKINQAKDLLLSQQAQH
jgi:hypothetical protein